MVRQIYVNEGKIDIEGLHDKLLKANRVLARAEVVPGDVEELGKSLVERLIALPEEEPGDATVFAREALRKGAQETFEGLLSTDSRLKRRHLRIGFEQMRQALEEVIEGKPVRGSRSPGQLARWIVEVTGVPQREIAALLGVPERTFQRWLTHPTTRIRSEEELKLRVAAKCINHLRRGLTGKGVVNWFYHRNPDLKKTPARALMDLDKTPEYEPMLLRLSASTRYSGGT